MEKYSGQILPDTTCNYPRQVKNIPAPDYPKALHKNRSTWGRYPLGIQGTLEDLYQVEVSPTLISQVTDVLNEEVQLWRDSPLEAVYSVVWLDGIVVKVH